MCKKRSPDGWHRTETKLFVRLCPVCCAIAPKARDDYAEAATNFESCLIAHASRVLACCTATCVDASSSDVDRPRYLEKRFSPLGANRCIRNRLYRRWTATGTTCCNMCARNLTRHTRTQDGNRWWSDSLRSWQPFRCTISRYRMGSNHWFWVRIFPLLKLHAKTG